MRPRRHVALELGGLVAGEDERYEFKSVTTIRGAEARTIAKWQKDGWELDTQDRQLLRTKMVFRRVQAKQRWGVLVVAMLFMAIILGVMAFQGRGADDATDSVSSSSVTGAKPSIETVAVTSRQPIESQSQVPPAPTTTAPEPKPLWTQTDGSKTIVCMASENIQEIRFTLPATAPIAAELNSILHDFDGRSPLTVLTITETDLVGYPDIDEADFLHTLYLETPSGDLVLDRRDNDAWFVLDDTRLAGIASDAGTKTLRDRARALSLRIDDDGLRGTRYVVTGQPITQVIAGHGQFKLKGDPCRVI